MYPSSIYFGLKVAPILGTLGPKYILFGYMDPKAPEPFSPQTKPRDSKTP